MPGKTDPVSGRSTIAHVPLEDFVAHAERREGMTAGVHDKPKVVHSRGHPSSLPFVGRLTSYLFIITVISVIFLLATIAFITFLWYSDESDPKWHRIVEKDWLTRTVTLLALVIRMAGSVQAGIATSMLAAIALEHTGVRLLQAPGVSFARFTNSGPLSLLSTYMLSPRPSTILPLLFVLTATTVALQFSSTLLLSDVSSALITVTSSNSSIPYGFRWQKGLDITDMFIRFQLSRGYETVLGGNHPLFGEYRHSPALHNEVDDTGGIIRAFVPLADQRTRESLHSYEGPASLFDSRVVCTQPEFSSLKFDLDGSETLLKGVVSPRHKIRDSFVDYINVTFSCHVPRSGCDFTEMGSEIQACMADPVLWSTCLLPHHAGGLMSALDPTVNSTLSLRSTSSQANGDTILGWEAGLGDDIWAVDLGRARLVWNATLMDPVENSTEEVFLTQKHTGAWTNMSLEFGERTLSMHASICYDALPRSEARFQLGDMNVSLTRAPTPIEPVTSVNPDGPYAKGSLRTHLETNSLVAQFGAMVDSPAPENRAILQLSGSEVLEYVAQRREKWSPDSVAKTWYDDLGPTQPWLFDLLYLFESGDQTTVFCKLCGTVASTTAVAADWILSSVFIDILKNTSSPALALQAHLTSRLRRLYYAMVPLFDTEANITTSSFVPRLAPTSHRGYWSVMGLLATHFVLCIIISAFFFTKTRYSRLGNSWSAIAEIARAKEAQQFISCSEGETDDAFERRIRAAGDMRTTFRLELDEGTSDLTLRRVVKHRRKAFRHGARDISPDEESLNHRDHGHDDQGYTAIPLEVISVVTDKGVVSRRQE